jgi:hypothetical protein
MAREPRTGAKAGELIPPPRIVRPKLDGRGTLRPDIGDGRRLAIAPRALSIGIPGLIEVDADASGVSVSTPVAGVAVDTGGVTVDAGKAGSVSVGLGGIAVESDRGHVRVGRDGATVGIPGIGGVTVGTDGSIRVTPSDGAPGLPGTPTLPALPDIPFPIPRIGLHPIEIPLPVPRLVMETVEIPWPMPKMEPIPWPRPDPGSWPGMPAVPSIPRFELPPLDLFDPVAGAIQSAFDLWRQAARFADIMIQGPLAIGRPGCLSGPRIEPYILSQAPRLAAPGEEEAFLTAVAQTVSDRFADWQDQVTVPALPWYPMFAAWPGPMAPPFPNTPFPLGACVSAGLAGVASAAALAATILDRLPAPLRPKWQGRARLVAVETSGMFVRLLVSRQVMNVLGEGPAPTFSPHTKPVAPVIDGRAWSPGPCIF